MRMARAPIAATMMRALRRKATMSSQKGMGGSVHDWLRAGRVSRIGGEWQAVAPNPEARLASTIRGLQRDRRSVNARHAGAELCVRRLFLVAEEHIAMVDLA